MLHRAFLASLLFIPGALAAQHDLAGRSLARTPPAEARQFDFLVGQWEVAARPRVSALAARLHGAPRYTGTWRAWRSLDGWGIEDELRLLDDAANPRSFSHSVRVYDPAAKHWNGSTLDVYRATFSSHSAEWRTGEMLVSSRGTDQEGRRFVARTRYYDITPASFKFQQDLSYDDGRTWVEGVLRIDAKRSAASSSR